jgi:hypothetical protein
MIEKVFRGRLWSFFFNGRPPTIYRANILFLFMFTKFLKAFALRVDPNKLVQLKCS